MATYSNSHNDVPALWPSNFLLEMYSTKAKILMPKDGYYSIFYHRKQNTTKIKTELPIRDKSRVWPFGQVHVIICLCLLACLCFCLRICLCFLDHWFLDPVRVSNLTRCICGRARAKSTSPYSQPGLCSPYCLPAFHQKVSLVYILDGYQSQKEGSTTDLNIRNGLGPGSCPALPWPGQR